MAKYPKRDRFDINREIIAELQSRGVEFRTAEIITIDFKGQIGELVSNKMSVVQIVNTLYNDIERVYLKRKSATLGATTHARKAIDVISAAD